MASSNEVEQGVERGMFSLLGPGLVTGASDDDPSGIATYSQVGAQFGYGMLWTMLFSYPLMAGIQETSADIGRVTGQGIAGNLIRHYPRWIAVVLVMTLVISNVINLGADIGAMGSALTLLIGGPRLIYASAVAIMSLLLQVYVPYHHYVKVLKWLTLAVFAYVGTAAVAHVDWKLAIQSTLLPSFALNASFITAIVAVLGTTISPYLFFWQASAEVEDQRGSRTEHALRNAPLQAPFQLRRIRIDTYFGMGFSNFVAFSIILAVAATLHAHGITDIQSSEQAAAALRPVAGDLAFLLFTVGIIGTGLLAIPVLAGSAAYAVGEAFGWRVGLERRFVQARNFYLVLAVSILVGLGLNFANINPIKALFWSAVINGVAAGPIMIMTMLMATSQKVMGQFTVGRRQWVLGWLATAVMIASSILMFVYWGR